MRKRKSKKGFTLIELIVTIAVLGILVLLGAPKLIGYLEKTELTRIQHDTKVMEQEMELALLDEEVNMGAWDDNAKDLGALILSNKLYEKEGFAERVDKSHLEKHYGKVGLASGDNMSQLGIGGDMYSLGSPEDNENIAGDGYKIIPSEYKGNIKTKLKGTFYSNELGKVYYENDKALTSQKENVIKKCDAPVASELGYTFEIIGGKGTITKYDHREQHLIIPAAFKMIVDGEEVCEPVRVIGTGAFMTGGYKSIVIPESVERIENEAFLNNDFTDVYIPHSVKHIGNNAFNGNYIESVSIGGKEGSVNYSKPGQEGFPFQNTNTGKNAAPKYVHPNLGYTFDVSQGSIISVPKPKNGVITIPEYVFVGGEEYKVRKIEHGALQGLGLISVVLPEGLERIEDYAFSGNQLVGITIPDSVVHIGNYAFSFNEQINSLNEEKIATIKTVMMKNEEHIENIDKYGNVLESQGGLKVNLLAGKLALLDHIFVTSIDNHVVDEKYVGGEEVSDGGEPSSPGEQSGPIIFSGLKPEAWDKDENTSDAFKGIKTVTWTGNLDHKELTIMSSKSRDENHSITFYGLDGKVLRSPSEPNSNVVTLGAYSYSGSVTKKVIVPKGAVKMDINSSWSNNLIKEIAAPTNLEETDSQEVKTSSDSKSITLSWDKPQRVLITKDNLLLSNGIMSSYVDKPLQPNSTHKYEVLFLDEYGNGADKFINVSETVKTRSVIFSGLSPQAWDKDENTSDAFKGTKTVTWTGDLDNKELTIMSSKTRDDYHTVKFYGSDGKVLRSPSSPDADAVSLGSYSFSGSISTKVIVPKGAVKMSIYSSFSSHSIKEITAPTKLQEADSQEVSTSSDDKSITLSWAKPQRVLIFKNNLILKSGTVNSYVDKPLHPGSTHEYKILFLDEYGNGAEKFINISETVKTRPIMFSGLTPQAWDGDANTSESFSGTKTVTWTGNLDNKELTIMSSKSRDDYHTVKFYGSDGKVLRSPSSPDADAVSLGSYSFSGSINTKVIVPKGAVKMAIYSSFSSHSIKEITAPN